MRLLSIALALTISAGSAVAGESPERFIHDTAGVYFAPDSRVGESVMEIVPFGPRKAYIRLNTMWSNGHSCSAYGIFRVQHDAYIYDGAFLDRIRCRMTIARKAGRFVMSVRDLDKDEGIQACLGGCGARGNFDRENRFTMRQRRPIRYMTRLLDSAEYEAAVAYDAGRIGMSSVSDVNDLPEVQAARAFEDPSHPQKKR